MIHIKIIKMNTVKYAYNNVQCTSLSGTFSVTCIEKCKILISVKETVTVIYRIVNLD